MGDAPGLVSALEAWSAVDLGNVQLALDDQAGQVADFREASLLSRKELAARTKEFKRREDVKKAPEDSVLKSELPKLLRAYQEEVDRLTQRSKFAENCFLTMYRLIREAPDPCEALSTASKEAYQARVELGEAQSGCEEAQSELEKVKAELQDALEALADSEKALEQREESGKSNEEQEETDAIQEALHEMEQRYLNQMEEIRNSLEEDLANSALQLEMTQHEADRRQEQVRELEARLASQSTQSSGNATSSELMSANKDTESVALKQLEEENQSLLLDLQSSREEQTRLETVLENSREELRTTHQQHKEQIASLEGLVAEQSEQVSKLRKAMSTAPSREAYDKLKSQLGIIQRELYSVQDEDTEIVTSAQDQELDGLEAFFVNSTRQLKKDLIEAKRTISELEGQVVELQRTEERLGEALNDQSELARKLERDLALNVQSHSQRTSQDSVLPELSVAPPSLQSTGDQSQQQVANANKQQQALNSMLQAVCAQRDRLRQQLLASEDRGETDRKRLEEVRRKVQSLEEDNVQLFQRIRFLQNYKASERSTLLATGSAEGGDIEQAKAAVVLTANGAPRVGGLGRGVEHRYKTLYESDINPLQAFQARESERVYLKMPPIERLSLKIFNTFLTRSRGRVFLVAYSAFLHALVALCWLT